MKSGKITVLALALVAIPAGIVLRTQDGDVATGAEESPPTVRAVGLMVNSQVGPGTSGFPELAFMGTFEKLRVALKLDLPGGGIVDLRRQESSLEVFGDDKGTELRKAEESFGPFEMNYRIAEDTKSVVFYVASDRLPQREAKRLTVKGTAAVMVAEETMTERAANVALEVGTKIALGPYSFEITQAGPSEWNESWSMTLTATQDLSSVVRYAFVDSTGAEVELRQSMSMWGGGTWQQTLESDRALEKGTVLLEIWKEPKVESVPFEVSLGLGLH